MSDARQVYQEALKLFREKRIPEAIAELEEAIRIDANFPDAYEALGVLYAQQGRLDEAIQVMKKLAAIAPDNIMAHTNLSRFYQEKGWIDEAEVEQAEARRLSWKAELKAKKVQGVQSAHETEKTPQQLAEEATRQLSARIETAKKAISFDPEDVLGYFSLGSVYLDAKRYPEAAEALQKAIEVDPNHSPSYASLGQVLTELERIEQARRVYEKGIEVASKRGDIIPLRRMESRLKRLSEKG